MAIIQVNLKLLKGTVQESITGIMVQHTKVIGKIIKNMDPGKQLQMEEKVLITGSKEKKSTNKKIL